MKDVTIIVAPESRKTPRSFAPLSRRESTSKAHPPSVEGNIDSLFEAPGKPGKERNTAAKRPRPRGEPPDATLTEVYTLVPLIGRAYTPQRLLTSDANGSGFGPRD